MERMGPLELAAEVACWTAGTWLLLRVRVPREPLGALPMTSVIIPARDEAASIPRLLASIARQPPTGAAGAPVEVIVVDDHSSDATAALARAGGATTLASAPLPPGWTGKAWACHQGAAASSGGTLVFLDADTWLESDGLGRVVGEQQARGGMVSVAPFHQTLRIYERASAWCTLVSMMGTGAFAPAPGSGRGVRAAAAFGPCVVVDRATYERIGGHRHPDVRGSVVEDLALARRAHRAGVPTTCLAGRGTVSFRMYPGGTAQLVDGWSKNLAAGATAVAPVALLAVLAWIAGLLRIAGRLAWALAAPHHPDLGAAVVAYLASAAQAGWMLRRIGRFGWATPVLWPLPLAAFLALFARSLWLRTSRRPATWRGRRVAAR